MKTSIIISGSGLNSKRTLLSACTTFEAEQKNLIFNDYELIFPTKKAAIKALSEAYQYLHSDLEDWQASCASYCRGESLSYDAGNARTQPTE